MAAPLVQETSLSPKVSALRIFARNKASVAGAVILTFLALLGVFGGWATSADLHHVGAGASMEPPSLMHLMGTDDLGRDVFVRVLSGIYVSLIVGLAAALFSIALGILVGVTSGYFGGLIDDALMRMTEIFQVLPRFFLAILMVAFFGAHIATIIVSIAILSWPEAARLIRAEVMSLRSRQYVDAARVIGVGNAAIIFGEILPNTLGPIIVNGTLQVGQAILLEAGLSYLGLGDPNQVSLGLLLYQAQLIMRIAWWTTAFPGLMIFLAVLAINIVGDGLNDVFNPRARER